VTDFNPLEKASSPELKILIADDHAIFRRGVKEILTEAFPNSTFGEAEQSQQLLDLISKNKWDVVILDVSMPGRSGLDSLGDIQKHSPKLSVLVLSMHSEEQYAVRVIRAGAAGYLTKANAGTELVDAVKKLIAGKRYVGPALAEQLALQLQTGSKNTLHADLSDREFEILKMIASGQSIKQISLKLSLSVPTVSTYRARILKKMRMESNAELMRYGMENGMVE
jgi:two-component system invasion response regulator UvrY